MNNWRALVIVFLCFFGVLTRGIDNDYFEPAGYNAAWVSNAVRNYQQYGIVELRFRETRTTGVVADDAIRYRNRHPPMATYLTALLVYPAGLDEFTVRLAAIFATLVGTAAFYVLVRRLFDAQVALWALILYTLTPMVSYFGRVPSHEPFALMFIMLFCAVWVNWLHASSLPRFLALLGLGMVATWTAWSTIAYMVVVGLITLWIGQWRQRIGITLIGSICILALGTLFLFYAITDPIAMLEIIQVGTHRMAYDAAPYATNAGDFTLFALAQRKISHLIQWTSIPWLLIGTVGIPFVWYRAKSLARLMLLGLFIAPTIYTIVVPNAAYVHDYYAIFFVPALALVGAGFLTSSTKYFRRVGYMLKVALLLLITVTSLITLYNVYTAPERRPIPIDGKWYATHTLIEPINAHTEPSKGFATNIPTRTSVFILGYYTNRPTLIMSPSLFVLNIDDRHERGIGAYMHCSIDGQPPKELKPYPVERASNGCLFYDITYIPLEWEGNRITP